MTTRRSALQAMGAMGAMGIGAARWVRAGPLPAGTLDSQSLEALSGKKPLIKRSFRPPNYETPLASLGDPITANDRFFVRWHWANIPPVDPRTWRLNIAGDAAARSVELSLADLRQTFERVEVTAVCQCAGNQRGLVEPHVPGVQWGCGAVGNAHWSGARLKDVLARAGLRSEALEIAFDAGDSPVLEQGPDFTKSIPVWKALEPDTLIAYEMNGEALPHWNGFPARLIVPGWAATYWVKQLTAISIRSTPLASFWMSTAYRVPRGKYPLLSRFESQESDTSVPVLDIDVNSVVTQPEDGSVAHLGVPLTVRGVAWDSGSGIRTVEVSSDGGQQWHPATLGRDLGRYSFRAWHHTLTPRTRGPMPLMTRATSKAGLTQPEVWTANPAGYHNNSIQAVGITVG